MTNPLNNLSKHPRRPFREKTPSLLNNKLPSLHDYEIPSFKELNVSISDSDFNDLIEDVTNDMAAKNLTKYSNVFRQSSKTKESYSARNESVACPPLSKDFEIISKLMERIKTLEISNRYQEKVIRDKELRNKILDEKCNLYKTASEVKDVKYDQMKELQNKCLRLENQITEMENFLSDYGLIWVGDKSFQCGSEGADSLEPACQPTPSRRFIVDYDKIFRNIDELNIMMDAEETKMAMTAPQRVELKKQQSVPIAFYSNGICLYSGPFRPFSDELTRQVINDIQDGYFPSELESRYPTGVPIEAIDRRNIMYDAKSINVFQGPGRTLGGNFSSSKLTEFEIADGSDSERYNQPYTSVMTSNVSTQLTMDQFLNQLPQSTISKDGKILAIRSSIRDIVERKQTVMVSSVSDVATSGDVAKIKIRSLTGDRIYNLTVSQSDLIGDLYKKLHEVSGVSGDRHVLVLSYPSRKVLSDWSMTIEQCGLTPTASLHIESLKTV